MVKTAAELGDGAKMTNLLRVLSAKAEATI
jgi:hypothetical protein